MKVGLKGGSSADERDIAALEAVIGQPLDTAFRKFLSEHNGAEPESNSFAVAGLKNVGGVNEFIPVEQIIDERSYIEDIPAFAYPVALSAGGNYVFLDQGQGGAIFFWDHEVLDGVRRIADNFDAFLDMIEPFDVSSVKLVPGQVKSAWIDPDFLKEIGDD